jgi:hypothetical protein
LSSLETSGQFFRVFSPQLPSFVASILLISLYYQTSPTDFSNLHRVLVANAPQLTVVPAFFTAAAISILP